MDEKKSVKSQQEIRRGHHQLGVLRDLDYGLTVRTYNMIPVLEYQSIKLYSKLGRFLLKSD